MPLNAGILIIGSLLWDPERQAWRGARLRMALADTVMAPIRYGRLSGKRRGYTYTMVYSRMCEIGQARVVHCSHTVSSTADLISEAEHLWKAEQPDAKEAQIAAGWGCVALLCNPDRKIPNDLLKGWASRVGQEPGYGNVLQTEEEGCLVGKDGLLRIPWPRLVEGDAALQLDILLATANNPTLTGTPLSYPSVDAITEAWNRASNHVEYFWRNVDSEIRTFQDDEIRARLRPRS